MSDPDLGGDTPCWAHLFEESAGNELPEADDGGALVVDLGAPQAGSGGAIWSLPHGGDLDANLVSLDPGQTIAAHCNDEVDVILFVRSGTGDLTIDNQVNRLDVDHFALIPRGAGRSIEAGPRGITYLSIHRKRRPLGIGRREDKDR